MSAHLKTQPTKKPTRKLATATGTGVLGTPIVAWLANDIVGLTMPELVAAEIAIVIGGVVGYFLRDRA